MNRPENIVAAARTFVDELRRRGDEIETARRLPRDISDRFALAGFYRTCVPRLYGGLECPPADTARMIETLATGDASAAWCAFIGATSGSVLAQLPDATARAMFAKPETTICGVFAPRGRADRHGDGYRVNGRWQWGSGTENADWVLGGCVLYRDGEPERSSAGTPRAHMMLVPASEVHFLDTWNVSGLCGTGSTDFELVDVFVPQERIVGYLRSKPLDGALWSFPQFGLLGLGIAAVTLGIARAAIDELIELAGGKKPMGSRRTLAERATTQIDTAQAEALLRSSRAFFYEVIGAAWEAATRLGELTVEHRRDMRLATTHAVRCCAKAVDLMYDLGGGTSVYRSSRLQRMFRDVHVATQHMMVSVSTMELVGRLLLGLETDVSQL
ncbi:MAG TPA: acyl-CoA dehydrogenase family protein [Candidatus Acidoferrales bacterium]|nr:acyl-CoA dehydrogenase family protein [Candidatus Acidoferrales bacterium]